LFHYYKIIYVSLFIVCNKQKLYSIILLKYWNYFFTAAATNSQNRMGLQRYFYILDGIVPRWKWMIF
jgi:hypothetical protein